MKSKKILLMLVVLVLTIVLNPGLSYADSLEVGLTPNSKEYSAGQTVIVTVSLEDISSTNGIYGLEGTLTYPTDVFDKIVSDSNANTDKITSLGDWEKVLYNSDTGEFKITTNTPVKEKTDIMQIALTVKNGAPLKKAIIMLDKLKASNGSTNISTATATATVEIKEQGSVPIIPDGTPIPTIKPSAKPSAKPTSTPTIKPSQTPVGGLPQTGIEENTIPLVIIGSVLLIGVLSYVGYKRYNKMF